MGRPASSAISWVLRLLACCMLTAVASAADPLPANGDVHLVFLTDCTSYSDWQTLGMVFSWRESAQVGCTG